MKRNKIINTIVIALLALPNLVPMSTYAEVTEYQSPDTSVEQSSMDCKVIYKSLYEFVETIPKFPELEVSAYGYEGQYDGKAHSITVGCETGGAIIRYSFDGKVYTTKKPVYTDVGTYVTYFKVEKDGYMPAVGSATVTITEAMIGYEANDYNGFYDGRMHSIYLFAQTSGCKILYSEDGINFSSHKPEYKELGTYVIYYKISKDNYATVTGSSSITIKPKETVTNNNNQSNNSNQNNNINSNVQTGDDSNMLFYGLLFSGTGIGLTLMKRKLPVYYKQMTGVD